ncbi:cytochrome P450 307a1-like [Brevipalpus obovatus]|uniref:cytochrome P450 307a1-like n=1 Tax=Brevipalpus obovatus TaxID=246614 RepID=UPI003D9F8EAA
MLDIFALIFISIILVYLYSTSKKFDQKSNSPPSPFRLPIIGHLHLMRKYSKEPWKAFDELAKKYGEIYSLQLGQCNYVVIAGVDSAREALIKNGSSCLDRPLFPALDIFMGSQQNSIHFANWSTLHQKFRKLLLTHTLSDGLTRYDQFQEISARGIKNLMTDLGADSLLCVNDLVVVYGHMMLDYICGTNFQNSKFEKNWEMCSRAFIETQEICFDGHIINAFPVLEHLKFIFPSIRKLCRNHGIIMDFMENDAGLIMLREKLKEDLARNTGENGENNFAELIIKKHLEDPSNLSWRKSLTTVMSFLGNFIPVAYLTMVCLGYLSLNQKYQEKVYQEIKSKIDIESRRKIISLNVSRKLVHIEAALMEVVRLTSPIYLPRLVTQDMTVKGYHIPKGTGLMINIYTLDHSSSRWESPENFIPERFLIGVENNGSIEQEVHKPRDHHPFGLGRRSCPGYGLYENLV